MSTNSEVEQLLKENNIDFTGWSTVRKAVAAEQLMYAKNNIEVGKIDGLVGEQTRYARAVFKARESNKPLVETWRDIDSLADINPYQLAFIRGIGETETGFSKKEAYSEAYNKPSNNANVKKYGDDGADYGYYQNNGLDVKQLIKQGLNESVAKHLNGGGKNGNSTIEEQTIAMHFRLQSKYKEVYENLKTGSGEALETAIAVMRGHWFGLKDRPQLARAAFAKGKTGDWKQIFPEAVKPEKTKKVSSPSVWPTQSDCSSYYGPVGSNQTTLILPFPMKIAWEKSTIITKFSCHEKVHDSMLRCFNRIADAYDASQRKKIGIDLFGGCLNVRKMRGGSSWSMHSWGIAIDFDPDRNQYKWGKGKAKLSEPDAETFWKIWEDEGWVSLGRERNFDWMHVQAARL